MNDINFEDFMNGKDRHLGTVTKYFPDRGFGFIKDRDSGENYFAHIHKFVDGEPVRKALYEFSIGTNKKSGKDEAYNIMTVELPEERRIRY
ncbi:MAG: hypothetical protein RSC29_04565 [Oscillospiraceae bacterium]